MKTFILLTDKPWHDDLYMSLQINSEARWFRIRSKSEFTIEKLTEMQPEKIFIPHWSFIIPSEIFSKFECIVFHMTDLPYGRGGSPLQNLIINGHESTMVSALRVSESIDSGKIYLKESLGLSGTAEEIFIRSSKVINIMINRIITENPTPVEQKGHVVTFKRRKPEESNISKLNSLDTVYDYIRMLDCEGYPKAFIETEGLRFEFSKASLKADHSIIADVRITTKK